MQTRTLAGVLGRKKPAVAHAPWAQDRISPTQSFPTLSSKARSNQEARAEACGNHKTWSQLSGEAAAGLPLGASCIRNIPTNDRRGRGLLDGLEWKVGRKDCSQVNNSLVLASQLWHLLNLSLCSIIKAEHAALSDLSET